MRTTIDIPTPLFKRAKAAAARDGTTLREVLLRALEAYLAAPVPAQPYRFEWEGIHLGKTSEAEFWEMQRDQDRQWYKEYLAELEERRKKER